MSLIFPNGQPFATGATAYQYRSATALEMTPRMILDVVIEGLATTAMVDTGGIYLLCNPRVATQINLDAAEAISGIYSLLFRGVVVDGRLYRLTVTLLADEGVDLTFQATAFVPELQEAESWGEMPSILGLYGCLERVRCAIDPLTETFYFGASADAS